MPSAPPVKLLRSEGWDKRKGPQLTPGGGFRLDMREDEFTERVIRYHSRLPWQHCSHHSKKYVDVAAGDVAQQWPWPCWGMVAPAGLGGLFQGFHKLPDCCSVPRPGLPWVPHRAPPGTEVGDRLRACAQEGETPRCHPVRLLQPGIWQGEQGLSLGGQGC